MRWSALQLDAVRAVHVVELTGLGDLVVALSVLPVLRRAFPAAALHVLTDARHAPLVSALRDAPTVHAVARRHSPAAIAAAVRGVPSVRGALALSISPARRNAAAALLLGADAVAGYLAYRDTLTPFLCETPVEACGVRLRSAQTYGRENIYERPRKVLRALGVAATDSGGRPEVDSAKFDGVLRGLRAAGRVPQGPYTVFHPFAGWGERAWPPGRFVDLARRIAGEGEGEVVFLVSDREAPLAEPLHAAAASLEGVSVCVSPDALVSAALIAGADAFVGNDSGPLHLAAWFGRPRVGLFGPAPPELTAPGGASVSMLRIPVECSPCDQRVCVRTGGTCMALLGVEQVHEAFRALRGGSSGPDHERPA